MDLIDAAWIVGVRIRPAVRRGDLPVGYGDRLQGDPIASPVGDLQRDRVVAGLIIKMRGVEAAQLVVLRSGVAEIPLEFAGERRGRLQVRAERIHVNRVAGGD